MNTAIIDKNTWVFKIRLRSNVLRHSMSHSVALCQTLLHHVTLCQTLLHHVKLRRTLSQHINLSPLSYSVTPFTLCKIMSHSVTPCHTFHTVLYSVTPCHALSHCVTLGQSVTLCHNMLQHVTLSHIVSHPVPLYHTMSHIPIPVSLWIHSGGSRCACGCNPDSKHVRNASKCPPNGKWNAGLCTPSTPTNTSVPPHTPV